MLPLLREGMVVEVAPLARRAKRGDVIVFGVNDFEVAHRVVGYRAEHYVTSGDAQPLVVETVAPAAVLGRVECVWEDASADARRVDTLLHRLHGWWRAALHPVRRSATALRERARRAARRLLALARSGPKARERRFRQ